MTIFRALAHRNYRLFFSGQSISLVGTWMQQIATSWLIFDLTHSAFLLGIVTFASRIPTFLLASFAGVLVDRWNRHRILVVTQILSMIQALALAFLVLTGRIEVWQIIGLSLILGLINALDIPARQAFVIDMVETKEDLGNSWSHQRPRHPSSTGLRHRHGGDKRGLRECDCLEFVNGQRSTIDWSLHRRIADRYAG